MDIPVLFGRNHLFGQSDLAVILFSQLFLGLKDGHLTRPLVADHHALCRDYLPQKPLEHIAETEAEYHSHSKESTAS